MAHSNLNCEPVSVVVTTNHDNDSTENDTSPNCKQQQRPDHLLFLDPNSNNEPSLLCSSPANGSSSYNCAERRGSKSCLRVISHYDESGQPVAVTGSGSLTPTRRRSVHFDASPAATVEVPSSDADKAQRGSGCLIGPAPFVGGKEVYVAPPPDTDEDDESTNEETKRLALAKAIARRQSGSGHNIERGGATTRNRLLSPPPPPIEDDINEPIEDTSSTTEILSDGT